MWVYIGVQQRTGSAPALHIHKRSVWADLSAVLCHGEGMQVTLINPPGPRALRLAGQHAAPHGLTHTHNTHTQTDTHRQTQRHKTTSIQTDTTPHSCMQHPLHTVRVRTWYTSTAPAHPEPQTETSARGGSTEVLQPSVIGHVALVITGGGAARSGGGTNERRRRTAYTRYTAPHAWHTRFRRAHVQTRHSPHLEVGKGMITKASLNPRHQRHASVGGRQQPWAATCLSGRAAAALGSDMPQWAGGSSLGQSSLQEGAG